MAGMTVPISTEAPAWQLEQIALWHEAMAQRQDGLRHIAMARRLRAAAKVAQAPPCSAR